MMMHFKKNLQSDRSMRNLLLTESWNSYTQSGQYPHAITQDIAKLSIKFE